MIDLRCHILDGTPCGPDSFAESLEMCRAAVADGVRTMVATPRWEAGCGEPPLPFEECRRKLKLLEAEAGGALSLKLGFALQFSEGLPALAERHGTKLTLAGKRHLLVSMPSVEVPAAAERVWESLRRAGFQVILAHPECNTVLRRDAARLARWVSEGVTLQVDAASIAGTYGREVRRFALECLQRYEGHAVVASNVRWSAGRRPSLRSAREELADQIGSRQASGFIRDVPAAIIEDGAARGDGRRSASRGVTTLFGSISLVKTLMGGS